MSQDRLGKLSPLLSNTALFGNENPIEKMVFFNKVSAVIYPLSNLTMDDKYVLNVIGR